ncbi:cysteine--tRNA ligase [Nocardioides salsibiostraticola]
MPQTVVLGAAPVPVVGSAKVYVCGITPYDVTHLGHASTFVWADVLAATLESTGVVARVCRNITDIDDVLTSAAKERGRYFDELALTQEAQFDMSMRALRVPTPADEPRARHHVNAVAQLAAALLGVGAAYERDGTVWFRGGEIWKSAGLTREEALARSEAYGDNPGEAAKDDPFDVPIWLSSGPEDPAWPSPWGWGRPGWHAECAAMAMMTLGTSVDVLVGGEDLIFPHHVYQAAMVQAVSGVAPFARAALHVGEVRLAGEKMAKSTGNLVLVDDLLKDCSPAALRMLLIDRRYGEAWDFDPADLEHAQSRLERLYAAAGRPGTDEKDVALARLRDDLDVPGALDAAEAAGGETARALITTLRLG